MNINDVCVATWGFWGHRNISLMETVHTATVCQGVQRCRSQTEIRAMELIDVLGSIVIPVRIAVITSHFSRVRIVHSPSLDDWRSG